MAWSISGSYFENCNCDVVCPCTWSGLSRPATNDRCNALLGFHIEEGNIEGVDVTGLSFALLLDTPKQMTDGNWRVGLLLDQNASEEQAAKIQGVATGELGGPMAMVAGLVGEILGVERAPVTFEKADGVTRVSFGDLADLEATHVRSIEGQDVWLDNVPHPASRTLTIAPATKVKVNAFGIDFGKPDTSGFTASFSWSG
jgi:hypothetical protein